MQNPFENSAFSMVEMTAAINVLPNQYGRINQLNLFPVKGVSTRTVIAEERNGTLSLIKSAPVGSPGQMNRAAGRKVRTFAIPQLPLDDMILPEDVQGIRAFGTMNGTDPVATKVNERLQEMKNKHDQTLEWLRMGALKGQIVDADGGLIYDLFSEFGVSQVVINFDLANANSNVLKHCLDLKRSIEDNLMGESMNGVRTLVSPEFYDAFVSHKAVQAAYANWQAAENRLGGDMRGGFTFGGVTFEEYRAVTSFGDVAQRYIAAGEGHAFPIGTTSAFATIVAPADFNETANTVGMLLYAKSQPRDFGRGMDIHTQSNPLPICYRPKLLVKVTA